MKILLESLPVRERPVWRVAYQAEGCSLIELLAAVVDSIGKIGASKLQAALELSSLLSVSDQDNPPTINTPEDAAALMMYYMQSLEQEHMFVILLNTRNYMIGEPVEVYH